MLFRAQSLSDAYDFIYGLVKLDFGPIKPEIFSAVAQQEIKFICSIFGRFVPEFYNIIFIAFFVLAFCLVLGAKNAHERLKSFKPTCFNMIGSAVLLAWSIISFSGVSTFLYFNF